MSFEYGAPATVPADSVVPSNVFGTPPVGAPQQQYVPAVQMPTPGAPATSAQAQLDMAQAVAIFNGQAAPQQFQQPIPQTGVVPMPLQPAQPANAPQPQQYQQQPGPAYQQQPAVPVNAPAVPANYQQPQQPQQPAPPVADLQTQLTQLATDYGVQPHLLQQFTDVKSAEAAIAMFASQAAVAGLNYTGQPAQSPYPQYPQQPQPYIPHQQQPALPALPPDVLKLNLDDVVLDDATKENFKALQAAYTQQAEEVKQLSAHVKAQEESRRAQVRAENKRVANDIVDKAANSRYGTSTARTPQQAYQLEQLFRKADEIQLGLYQNGLPVPQIGAIVRQAMLLDGAHTPYVPAPAAPVQPASPYGDVPAQVPIGGAPPAQRPAAPIPNTLKPTSHLGNLHQDPAFMSVAARLLSRP